MTGFNNYKKEIINAYQTLKQTGRLASDLENPSPAQLRDYCLELWANRYEKADVPIIKSFFDPGNRYDDLESAIKQSDIDKLRPLINFMTKGIQNRDDKHVKLLAWLIDFQPRPYELWREQRQRTQITGITGTAKPTATNNPPPTDPPLLNNTSVKGVFMVIIISVATALGIYFFTNLNGKTHVPQCMYWEGNQYQPIACEEKIPGIMVLPFDTHKIKHFKRITRPDTLDYTHVGTTWYTKAGMDSVEFFTDAGLHPTNHKTLRPVTNYIIRKYVKGED